jgi:hypothetical protein
LKPDNNAILALFTEMLNTRGLGCRGEGGVTPIENRASWEMHRLAFRSARACGSCFGCATELGFRATDMPGSKRVLVRLYPRCERKAQEAA